MLIPSNKKQVLLFLKSWPFQRIRLLKLSLPVILLTYNESNSSLEYKISSETNFSKVK